MTFEHLRPVILLNIFWSCQAESLNIDIAVVVGQLPGTQTAIWLWRSVAVSSKRLGGRSLARSCSILAIVSRHWMIHRDSPTGKDWCPDLVLLPQLNSRQFETALKVPRSQLTSMSPSYLNQMGWCSEIFWRLCRIDWQVFSQVQSRAKTRTSKSQKKSWHFWMVLTSKSKCS